MNERRGPEDPDLPWANRGTRTAPQDRRTPSDCIFDAICPAEGKGAATLMPRCVTEAMTAQLAEIPRHVAPGSHSVVPLDLAGLHQSRALGIPDNIVPLPAHAPGNIRQSMRDKIVRSQCAAWNRLVDQP